MPLQFLFILYFLEGHIVATVVSFIKSLKLPICSIKFSNDSISDFSLNIFGFNK